MKKIRPLGDITLDMEKYINEMVNDHDLQWHEILGIIHAYLMVHHPEAREVYINGGNPQFYYGYKEK